MRLEILALAAIATLLMAGCAGASPNASQSPPATTAPTATVSDMLGSIEGLVVNEEAAPIQGADVGLQEPSLKGLTDAAGKFVFNDLAPGDYKIFASRLGYESVGKSVPVTAGEVAKVQFLLKAIALTNQSFYAMVPYNGYIECSVSAFSPVNCASATDQTTNSWIVDVDRTYPLKEVVIELVWTQASPATGNEMEIEFCDDLQNRNVLCVADQTGGYYVYADGTSPVVLRVTDVPKDAKQLLLGAGAKFGAQPVVQQKFTEYLTWCYVEACPDDYSALPKPG